MRQAGIQQSVGQITGAFVHWLILIFFLMAACNLVGMPTASAALAQVAQYVPKLMVAALVILVGFLLADVLRGTIATATVKAGIGYRQPLAIGVYYMLALLTVVAALEQLEIKFELLNYAILLAFGALALAVGLSVGLGGRELAGGLLAGYYVRQRLQAGDLVRVAGLEGRIREVGPVATTIETEDDGLTHRHSVPNSRMLRDAVQS